MRFSFLIAVLVATLTVAARTATLTDETVDTLLCRGYFPQLDATGTRLLVSNTEGHELRLVDLAARTSTVVSDEPGCGFDARFAPDGAVYYITQRRDDHRLVWRTLRRYAPATGRRDVVLEAQHGAVLPAGCSRFSMRFPP